MAIQKILGINFTGKVEDSKNTARKPFLPPAKQTLNVPQILP